MDITFPTELDAFTLRIWADPVVEANGFPVTSSYVELFWLPILGPSASWLLRRLAGIAEASPDEAHVQLDELARSLGLGGRTGRNSIIVKTLGRLVGFGMARWEGDALAVRRAVTPLTIRHVLRLPPTLVRAHDRGVAQNAVRRPA